jgi:hypothetical protein
LFDSPLSVISPVIAVPDSDIHTSLNARFSVNALAGADVGDGLTAWQRTYVGHRLGAWQPYGVLLDRPNQPKIALLTLRY